MRRSCRVSLIHLRRGRREGRPVGSRAWASRSRFPWPQLHESGGLDGRLAEELGVLTLPTMFLLDAQGNVVDRNLVITDLEKKLDSLLGAN